MESILQSAARKFISEQHIQNILEGEWVSLYNEHGEELKGIRGRIGAAALTAEGAEIGVDYIEMQPGSAFPLHTHQGDHLMYILKGMGAVHVDGIDHTVRVGDTIFIPAEYIHGLKAYPDASEVFTLLAFGHPHKRLDATDRMQILKN